MHGIAEIREKLDCTQAELGFLINRNKGIINDAQMGHRKLSPDDANKILDIWLACNAKDTQAPEVVYSDALEREESAVVSRKMIVACEFTLSRKQRELEKLQRQYAATTRAVCYVDWIMANPGDLDASQLDWLRFLRDAAVVRLEKVGLTKQRELEVNIACLHFEIDMRQSFLITD